MIYFGAFIFWALSVFLAYDANKSEIEILKNKVNMLENINCKLLAENCELHYRKITKLQVVK